MNEEMDERLIGCFQAVFPKMGREEIQKAAMTSVADWDSMVTITLLTLIEESFGVETDATDIEQLTSFEAISEYLRKKAAVCNAN